MRWLEPQVLEDALQLGVPLLWCLFEPIDRFLEAPYLIAARAARHSWWRLHVHFLFQLTVEEGLIDIHDVDKQAQHCCEVEEQSSGGESWGGGIRVLVVNAGCLRAPLGTQPGLEVGIPCRSAFHFVDPLALHNTPVLRSVHHLKRSCPF